MRTAPVARFVPMLVSALAVALVALLATGALAGCAPDAGDDRSARGEQRQRAGEEQGSLSSSARAERAFTFAAAGDFGATKRTTAFLRSLDGSRARFFLALGDLDYDQTPTDAAWCRYVKRHLPTKGPRFPFELVTGNHEDQRGPDGRIGNFTECLPDRMGATGKYGAQYAFSYPRTDPFARFIMISPHLKVAGHTYLYEKGHADRRWLVRQIDQARADGIRWVVVGMHYPCLTTGASHGCDARPAVANLLLRKKVDLVLTGHNHIYERSKQLRLDADTCPAVVPEQYDAGCVVDTGKDDRYTAGRGSVLVTAGAVRGGELGVDPNDGDTGFFARRADGATGYMSYRVTPSGIHARWVPTSGPLRDSFDLVVP